jgi:hypothetical protein
MVPSRLTNKVLPRRERISGKGKKTIAIAHQCKDPSNHGNHCNIGGDIKDNC